jgi:hypothetical protein
MSLLEKVYDNSTLALKSKKIEELIRVYQDLEKTLKSLKASYEQNSAHSNYINVKKLIDQLSRSKKKLERKIGNTVLLEKQHFKKRLKAIASNLASKSSS